MRHGRQYTFWERAVLKPTSFGGGMVAGYLGMRRLLINSYDGLIRDLCHLTLECRLSMTCTRFDVNGLVYMTKTDPFIT